VAPVPTLSFGQQLLKQLIVMCHKSNPVGEVDACALMPLPHNLVARGYVSQPLDIECGKVPQNCELVHVGEWLMLFVSPPLIFFDLFSQLFPPMNFFFPFWLGPHSIKQIVNIILLTL